jgi:hypothetical protein
VADSEGQLCVGVCVCVCVGGGGRWLILEIKVPGKSNIFSLGGDINLLGVELFHTDVQTDVTTLIVIRTRLKMI